MSSTANRIVKNTGFLYAKMAINVFISLYTTRLILNALGASDYGIYNVVGGVIAMLSFLNAAMASATQRYLNYSEGEGDIRKKTVIFNNSVVLHLGIALLVIALFLILKPLFFNHMININPSRIGAATWVYYFMIASTAFTVMTVPYDAILNSHENMLYYAIVGLIQSLLNLTAAFIITKYLGDRLILYGLFMALISILVLIIMRVYCKKHYQECVFSPKIYCDKKSLVEQGRFAGWNLFGTSASVISAYGSNLVLNNFFGTILNAAYGVCGQLDGQMKALSSNLLKAVNPIITKSEGAKNSEMMYKAAFSASKLSVLLYALITVPFFIDCPYILKIWLKNVPPYTIIFCQLVVVRGLIEQLTLPLGTVINAHGEIRGINLATSLAYYFSILALFLCYKIDCPPQAILWLAISVATFLSVYKIMFCKKYCGMNVSLFSRDVLLRIIGVISVTAAIDLIIEYSLPESLYRLCILCAVSFITFIISFYYIGLSQTEKGTIKKLTSNILKRFTT